MKRNNLANELTSSIMKYCKIKGYHCNRINVMGRQLKNGKWIPSSTRKGTADLQIIIKGKSVQLEIKAGNDKPSACQILEMEAVRKSGGIYEFAYNLEDAIFIFKGIEDNCYTPIHHANALLDKERAMAIANSKNGTF